VPFVLRPQHPQVLDHGRSGRFTPEPSNEPTSVEMHCKGVIPFKLARDRSVC